jgi:hypothetical protein
VLRTIIVWIVIVAVVVGLWLLATTTPKSAGVRDLPARSSQACTWLPYPRANSLGALRKKRRFALQTVNSICSESIPPGAISMTWSNWRRCCFSVAASRHSRPD